MSVCCNLDCDGWTPEKRIRCGNCRFSRSYKCACCGDDVNYARKIYCVDCGIQSKQRWAREYRREYKRINRSDYRVLS